MLGDVPGEILDIQFLGGRFHRHAGHHRLGSFQRVQHGVMEPLAVPGASVPVLALLPFGLTKLLRQLRGHLGHVAFVQILHQPFGHGAGAVIHRIQPQVHAEPVGVMLEQPDALGIHAGRRQVDDLRDAVLAVGARRLDVGQVHIGTDMHAERVGDAVHHLAHAERPGAGAQVQGSDAHDDAGLRRQPGLRDRLVPITLDVLHIQGDGMGMVLAYGRRAAGFLILMP